MAGSRGFTALAQRHGGKVNRVVQSLKENATRGIEQDAMFTSEPCVVYDYDPEKQRVDVVLKNSPKSPVIRGVPIAGAGGDFRIIRSMRTMKDKHDDPTVGLLVFPRTDSRTSWKLRDRSKPYTQMKHRPVSPIFMDTVLLEDEAPFSDDFVEGGGLNDIDKGDTALIHRSGSRIVFKENGDVLILSAGNMYIGPTETDAGSFPEAARKGDGVSHPSGPISGGSSKVNIG